MKIKNTVGLLLFGQLVLCALPGLSQEIYIDLNNSAGTADYLLGSRLVENAAYSATALGFSSILSDNSKAHLDVSHSQIYPNAEYSSTTAELGLQFRYLKIKDNQIFYGIQGFTNRYRDTYSYYNSSGVGAYGKWKHYFKPGHLVTFGYDLNIKRFDEVEEASNSEHEFYAIYNQSFQTKSSLQIRSSYGVQDFLAQSTISGFGRYLTVEESDLPTNTLVSNELRLSQSLGTKLGFTLWLGNQFLINDSADSMIVQDGLENPFTDRFRWEGSSASSRIRYRLNADNSFSLSHSYLKKSYLDIPVYLFDFEVMDYALEYDETEQVYELVSLGYDREDERNQIQVSWSHYWIPSTYTWLSDIEFVVSGGWTQNSSNDALYDYESMNYSLSINLRN